MTSAAAAAVTTRAREAVMSVHLEAWMHLHDRPARDHASEPEVGSPEHKVTYASHGLRRSRPGPRSSDGVFGSADEVPVRRLGRSGSRSPCPGLVHVDERVSSVGRVVACVTATRRHLRGVRWGFGGAVGLPRQCRHAATCSGARGRPGCRRTADEHRGPCTADLSDGAGSVRPTIVRQDWLARPGRSRLPHHRPPGCRPTDPHRVGLPGLPGRGSGGESLPSSRRSDWPMDRVRRRLLARSPRVHRRQGGDGAELQEGAYRAGHGLPRAAPTGAAITELVCSTRAAHACHWAARHR